ncbi:hypothetical protein CFBP6762_04034 [Xanthomonas arboricola pv. fragariae]|nr:hypothetical protein XarCFBP6762_10210 [Xanthomonas arboricola]SOU04727.1 hypothetical protein CFBP6762_04034 [Xanthomonas arboricola pv. fragariae]
MSAATRIAFALTVFNFCIGNSDVHLKTFRFLRGTNGWELAPHSDLLSASVYKPRLEFGRIKFPMGTARS